MRSLFSALTDQRFLGRLAILACCCTALISCGGGGGDDMAAGVEIQGQSGEVMIDADYKTLSFISKATVNTSASGGLFRGSFAAPAGTNRVFAIRSSVPTIISTVVGDVVSIATTAQASVDVYVFAETPSTADASGVGLVVYNAAGQITFSSDMKYMRVVGAAQVPSGTAPFNYNTLPTGTYAAALSWSRMNSETGWMGGLGEYTRIYRDFVRTHGNGAEVALVEAQLIPSGNVIGAEPRLSGGQLMIFDVSGY